MTLYTLATSPTAEGYLSALAGTDSPRSGKLVIVGEPTEGLLDALTHHPDLDGWEPMALEPVPGGATESLPSVSPEALSESPPDLLLVCPDRTIASLPVSLFETAIPRVVGHSRRAESVVVVSLPKSGSNLQHRLFRALDYQVIGDGARDSYDDVNRALFHADRTRRDGSLPFDFLVSTFGDRRAALFTHALRLEPDTTIRDLGGNMEDGSPLWDWINEGRPPLVFNYRDPRDILVSLAHYLTDKPVKNYWASATQTILRQMGTVEERLDYLIRCVPRYLDLYFRQHFWLLHHPAVCKVRFEDIVGARGSGSDAARTHAVLRVMEQVGFEGDAHTIGETLFSSSTRTFRKGQIGGWAEAFSARHRREFEARHADILEIYGYG